MNNADWEADAIYFLKMRGGYTDKELDTKEKNMECICRAF